MGWYMDTVGKVKRLETPFFILYVTAKVLGGVAMGRMVTVSTLAFGGEVMRDVQVQIYQRQPMPGFPSGLLGVGALRRFRAVLDHGRGQLHLVRQA